MKKKIAILGSTGSIGKSTLEVISKDKENFDIFLSFPLHSGKELCANATLQKIKTRNTYGNNFFINYYHI